ncbi:MAG TPA: Gfo/Idh/MocA family oxidoreductase, partial [Lacipirellulaceae bacterium]|nr:Gfo/Idh/MocA family oxidoreductase [Lacipirellulaceae bacterium]
MNKIRLGIVGCGVIGQYHIRHASASARIEVTALADLHVEQARSSALQYNVRHVYQQGLDLIDSPHVDAVVLAVPTDVRFELAQSALIHGKHVLLEKPAAMNIDEVKQLIAMQGSAVVASCSSRNRMMASAQVATDFISSGRLGAIRLLHCRALNFSGAMLNPLAPHWRLRRQLNGGGVFANWGSYDLDFLLGICGWQLRPRTVLARTWMLPTHFVSGRPIRSDVETHVAAMICCDEDAVIHYERAESTYSSLADTWQVVGTRGALSLNLNPGQCNQVVFDSVDLQGRPTHEVLWQGEDTEDMIH